MTKLLLCVTASLAVCCAAFHTSSHIQRRPTSLNEKFKRYYPGSELFPEKGSAYVPSGMTPEQYTKIKKAEKEKEAKLDFGMWGPRFQQIEQPTDDWMVMPRLWTTGFQSNGATSAGGLGNGKTVASPPPRPVKRRVLGFIQKNGPAYLMAYLLLDTMVSAFAMLRASQLTIASTSMLVVRVLTRRKHHALLFVKTMGTVAVAKTMASALMVPTVNKYIERANRKWLWTPKRTIVTTVAAAMGGLLAWGFLLLGIRFYLA